MRNIIIGLSTLFLLLSCIITFKALQIPERIPPHKSTNAEPETNVLTSKVENMLGEFAKEQAANRALVDELQATISTLETKLSSKEEQIQTKIESDETARKARVLVVLGAGLFGSGQVFMNENLTNTVSELVPEILASPGYRVVIEGHTDNIPISVTTGKRYRDNMELSFLRAKSVALILEKNAIPLDRISVIGYGDTRPIDSNETAEGRVKNRRVEVKLVPDDKEL